MHNSFYYPLLLFRGMFIGKYWCSFSMPHCCALSNGDRIVWFDRIGVPRHGTVRWIGRLKGHSNIYVGVDFVGFLIGLYFICF